MPESEPIEQELAARAWIEALTSLDGRTDYRALRTRLGKYFTDDEICRLTAAVTALNLWKRLRACRH